jgi:hypothetical protein
MKKKKYVYKKEYECDLKLEPSPKHELQIKL